MNLLITKTLPADQLDMVRSFGWTYDVIIALEITIAAVDSIPSGSDAWIISSRNSMQAVEKFKDLAPDIIYVVGEWLHEKIKALLANAKVRSYPNMKALTDELSKASIQSVLYFCADNHREDLDKGLAGSSVTISKVITHHSRETNPVLSKNYDVVLMFSPRSAKSLLTYNNFESRVLLACIGQTTEWFLHVNGFKNTFCASKPDSGILLKELHTHLSFPKNP